MRRLEVRSVLWLVAAFGLLLFPLRGWRGWGDRALLWPNTPFENCDAAGSEEWLFLASSRQWVPAGESFTVIAEPQSREMTLFMMSYGLFPRAVPIPSSYWGNPTHPVGEAAKAAKYVLALPCEAAGRDGLRLLSTTEGGCVLVRRTSAR